MMSSSYSERSSRLAYARARLLSDVDASHTPPSSHGSSSSSTRITRSATTQLMGDGWRRHRHAAAKVRQPSLIERRHHSAADSTAREAEAASAGSDSSRGRTSSTPQLISGRHGGATGATGATGAGDGSNTRNGSNRSNGSSSSSISNTASSMTSTSAGGSGVGGGVGRGAGAGAGAGHRSSTDDAPEGAGDARTQQHRSKVEKLSRATMVQALAVAGKAIGHTAKGGGNSHWTGGSPGVHYGATNHDAVKEAALMPEPYRSRTASQSASEKMRITESLAAALGPLWIFSTFMGVPLCASEYYGRPFARAWRMIVSFMCWTGPFYIVLSIVNNAVLGPVPLSQWVWAGVYMVVDTNWCLTQVWVGRFLGSDRRFHETLVLLSSAAPKETRRRATRATCFVVVFALGIQLAALIFWAPYYYGAVDPIPVVAPFIKVVMLMCVVIWNAVLGPKIAAFVLMVVYLNLSGEEVLSRVRLLFTHIHPILVVKNAPQLSKSYLEARMESQALSAHGLSPPTHTVRQRQGARGYLPPPLDLAPVYGAEEGASDDDDDDGGTADLVDMYLSVVEDALQVQKAVLPTVSFTVMLALINFVVLAVDDLLTLELGEKLWLNSVQRKYAAIATLFVTAFLVSVMVTVAKLPRAAAPLLQHVVLHTGNDEDKFRLAWYIANVPLVYRLLGFEVRQWAVALFVLGSIFLQGARMLRAVGPDPYQ